MMWMEHHDDHHLKTEEKTNKNKWKGEVSAALDFFSFLSGPKSVINYRPPSRYREYMYVNIHMMVS